MQPRSKITRWLPGIEVIRTYRSEWLRSDLVAGLSIAAVALPIGIAYAQLAGFPPVVGIYSCFPSVHVGAKNFQKNGNLNGDAP